MALSWVNLFAADIEALSGFYRELFGLEEDVASRSPIFIALNGGGGVRIGFNAPAAYNLLELGDHAAASGVKSMLTFDVPTITEVDSLTALAQTRGARLVKAPYATYYKAWQSVLFDPEGNVFRINTAL